MTNFTFIAKDEDGIEVTINFEADVWLDAFPQFLNLMKASGFYIAPDVGLYSPGLSEALFDNGDREFLIFDKDLVNHEEAKCGKCTPKECNDPSAW